MSSRVWLYFAVTADLLVLAYYKYFFPTLNSVGAMLHSGQHWSNVAVAVGNLFFYVDANPFLVDLYKGSAERQDVPSYLLFVTFFPHLIAGPILHHTGR